MKRIIIVDDSCQMHEAYSKNYKYDISYLITNNPNIYSEYHDFETPEFDYSKIEKMAYDLCEEEMEKILKCSPFNRIEKPFREAIKKNMLQIYGYYYKKAKLIDLVNRHRDDDITICSDYLEKGDIKDCKVINSYKVIKLRFFYLKTVIKRIISPLFHRGTHRVYTDTLVAIDSMVKLRLFKYYFPFIKEYSVPLLSDKRLPRVKKFIEYCDNNNIRYFEYINDSVLRTFFIIIRNTIRIGLPNNYKEYRIMKFYLDNLYAYAGFEELFRKNDIRTFIMSGEYNSISNLLSNLAQKYGCKFFNFQHGGVYLANHNYQNFIVMGQWVKDYYIKNTNSNKDQFLVLGNPFMEKNKGFDKGKLARKTLKILFTGQYLFGYVTRRRKENIIKCLKSISDIPGIEVTIKDHPGAKDSIVKKYFAAGNVRILGNNDNYKYEDYDLVLSIYSTTLIESIWCGVPSISLNFDKINGILLLERSKINQLGSCKEFSDFVERIKGDRFELMRLYEEEIKQIGNYWNRDNKDNIKLKLKFENDSIR